MVRVLKVPLAMPASLHYTHGSIFQNTLPFIRLYLGNIQAPNAKPTTIRQFPAQLYIAMVLPC